MKIMPINPNLLNALTPTNIVAMSDADAATALSVPTYTPLTSPVTITSLGAAWGAIRAATVYATLKGIAASADPSAPLVSMVVAVLTGPGFDATNAQSQATIAQLVTAGVCTQAEAYAATCSVSYPLVAPVATADVTAARAVLANWTAAQTLVRFLAWAINEVAMPLPNAIAAGTATAVPTIDALWTQYQVTLNGN
jgi:hypothetical protein